MNGLTKRNAPRLLGIVRGKPHATQDDHSGPLSTPPASNPTRSLSKKAQTMKQQRDEEDAERSPESSESEDAAPQATVPKREGLRTGSNGFRIPQNDGSHDSSTKQKEFRIPGSSAPQPSMRDILDHEFDEEDDSIIFSSQPPSNKKRRPNASAPQNIHAPFKKASTGRQAVYGKTQNPIGPRRLEMRIPRKPPPTSKPEAPKFRMPDAGGSNGSAPKPTFKFAGGMDDANAGAYNSSSPPLSSPLTSVDGDVEEVDMAAFEQYKPEAPTVDCAICGARVKRLLKEEFEDKFPASKAWTYKWQEYFCRYHKVDAAKIEAEEKGYPEIDWSSFNWRLTQHHGYLLGILEGRKPSIYRTKLQKKVSSGAAKSMTAVMQSKNKHSDFSPGYYGPRGEELMTEHITRHFGDHLRELSVSDPLIAASGLAGGVSGFVQAVLVPELAVALVRQDMSVDAKKASEILRTTMEIGELLNGEEREKMDRSDDGKDEHE